MFGPKVPMQVKSGVSVFFFITLQTVFHTSSPHSPNSPTKKWRAATTRAPQSSARKGGSTRFVGEAGRMDVFWCPPIPPAALPAPRTHPARARACVCVRGRGEGNEAPACARVCPTDPSFFSAQVEYAMEAISNAGSAIGVLATDGVVLAAEKRITSKVRECAAERGPTPIETARASTCFSVSLFPPHTTAARHQRRRRAPREDVPAGRPRSVRGGRDHG